MSYAEKAVVVLQGETATINTKEDDAIAIGSEDATTCVVAVAECSEEGLISCAHFDQGTVTELAVRRLLNGMPNANIYLCGAYSDAKGTGHKVASALVMNLHQ
eukprot:scaffold87752_cov41-Prasinocladus_malaysianus.AAC.1